MNDSEDERQKNGIVFHWIHTKNFGGLEKFVVLLHAEMKALASSSYIFFTRSERRNDSSRVLGSEDHDISDCSLSMFFKALASTRPHDVIHYSGNTMKYAPFIKGLFPSINHHRIFMHGFKGKRDLFHRFVFSFFKTNIFPTKLSLNDGARLLPHEHSTFLFQYFGVPLPHQTKAIAAFRKHHRIRICSLSRIEPNKGIREIVEAFSSVFLKNHSLRNGFEIFFYGEPHSHDEEGRRFKNELIEYVRARELSEHIRFMGHTDSPLTALLDADFLVFASYDEFYGFALIESFAAGVPAITVNRGSFSELNSTDRGFFLDFSGSSLNDLSSVESTLTTISELSGSQYEVLSSSALRYANEYFDIKRTTRSLLSTLQDNSC